MSAELLNTTALVRIPPSSERPGQTEQEAPVAERPNGEPQPPVLGESQEGILKESGKHVPDRQTRGDVLGEVLPGFYARPRSRDSSAAQ